MSATGAINLLSPFDVNPGTQTMHCSDCHGQKTSWKLSPNGPDLTQTQGPHGSDNNFLLKGKWDRGANRGNINDGTWVCGNCHKPTNSSGFASSHNPSGDMGNSIMVCMNCHIAIPHGWRNKAFLANLYCVGTEAGEAGTCVNIGGSSYGAVRRPPYYNDSRLRVSTWARSGSWGQSNCGSGMDNCS